MSSDLKDLWESAGGKAPEHWKFVRFEDLLADSKSIAVGVMYPGEHNDSGTPLIKVSDVKNGKVVRKPDFCIDEKVNHEYRRTMLKGNELLITLVGNPGDCAIVDESMKGWNAARALAVVRLKDPSLRPWVRYVLLSSTAKHLINARLNTTVQKTLNLKDVKSLPIPIASSDEIASIVDIASTLESKINLNQETNQTLEQLAQAIFKSWFVDFEPVKAKVAALEAGGSNEDALIVAMQAISGRDVDQLATMQAEKPQQYAQLRASAELFPIAMQDSELGEMPEGWALRSLTNFGTVVCGKTPPKSQKEFFGGDIPFIKIPDMHGGAFNTKYSEYLSDAGGNSQPKKFIPAGSICVSCIATVGKVLLTHRTSQTNQQINSIIPKSQFLREYLYFQMIEKNKLLHDLASGGSATLNLNTGNFSKIELLMPDEVILARYSGVVSSLFNEMLQNCMANETLTEIRDSLLPKLLSGEISVDSIHSDLTEEQLNATEVN